MSNLKLFLILFGVVALAILIWNFTTNFQVRP
jgi:hypothetical protein